MKIVIAAAVLVVMASGILATPPLLHNVAKKAVAAATAPRVVQVQHCDTIACTGTCTTRIEYPLNQCHNSFRAFSHGEIFRFFGESRKRMCFRETMYDSPRAKAAGCNGKIIQSAPRELGQCVQDVFPPGKFSIFVGNATFLTMKRDCDYGCRNCGMEIPLSYQQCIQGPEGLFQDISFSNGAPFPCGGEGWKEIIQDHFEMPTCDGQPDFVDSAWEDMCYVFNGQGHKFILA